MDSHAHKQFVSPPSSDKHPSETTQNIINSMRLEDVTINAEILKAFEACDKGELTEEECYEKGIQRILNQQNNIAKK